MNPEKNLKKYKCRPCGFVYDPEKGVPDYGIKPGVPLKTFQMTGYVQSVRLAGGCLKK